MTQYIYFARYEEGELLEVRQVALSATQDIAEMAVEHWEPLSEDEYVEYRRMQHARKQELAS